MWIKTMNQEFLVNTDKVDAIGIYPNEVLDTQRIISFPNDNKGAILGDYATKDDAHFVLERISSAIEKGKALFVMPDEHRLDVLKKNNTIKTNTKPISKEMIAQAIELWNSLQSVGIKPVSRIDPDSERGKNLKARLREYTIDGYKKAIENIRTSELLQSSNASWFNFDWFVKKSNFPKVLDGNYNRAKDRLSEEEKKFWDF